MKTLRELFVARHRLVEPALDEISRETVARLRVGTRLWWAQRVGWELFWPVRHVWLGLGAAWMVILALNVATGGETKRAMNAPGPVAPNSIIALERHPWRMAEEDVGTAPPAKPPEKHPRSEAPIEQKIV